MGLAGPKVLACPPPRPRSAREGCSVLAWQPLTPARWGIRERALELGAYTSARSDPGGVLPPWGQGLWAQERGARQPLPVCDCWRSYFHLWLFFSTGESKVRQIILSLSCCDPQEMGGAGSLCSPSFPLVSSVMGPPAS